MKHRDAYETLGVAKDADAATVKRAYRRRARKLHPDVRGGDEEKFKELQRAYALLEDPATRARYDQVGDAAANPNPLRDQAERQLALLFALCVAARGPNQPVLDLVRSAVEHDIRDLKARLPQIDAEAKRMAKAFHEAAERLTRKDGGDSLLAEALRKSGDDAANSSKDARGELEKLAEMLKVLDEHQYRLDRQLGNGYAPGSLLDQISRIPLMPGVACKP